MAIARSSEITNLETECKEVQVTTKQFTLIMSEDEAKLVVALTGKVGGERQKQARSIYTSLTLAFGVTYGFEIPGIQKLLDQMGPVYLHD